MPAYRACDTVYDEHTMGRVEILLTIDRRVAMGEAITGTCQFGQCQLSMSLEQR